MKKIQKTEMSHYMIFHTKHGVIEKEKDRECSLSTFQTTQKQTTNNYCTIVLSNKKYDYGEKNRFGNVLEHKEKG